MARWQLAALGGTLVLVALIVSGFLLLDSGGKSSSGATTSTPTGPTSEGNALLRGRAARRDNQYHRTIIIQATNRQSGIPLQGAKVLVHGEMTAPMHMIEYTKRLREVSRGTYKGPYTLVMPGDWQIVVIATSKTGDASTGSFPVHVVG